MKLSLKTLLATAVLGTATLPMLSSAQDEKPAPPPAEGGGGGGQRPGGGGGGNGGRRGGMPTPEQMVARLDEAVTLTAEQKTKATEIYKKMAADMQAVPQEQRREKGQEIRKATDDAIKALLTPEQQKKMPAPGGRGRGGPGGPGGPGGDRPPRGGGDAAPKKTE